MSRTTARKTVEWYPAADAARIAGLSLAMINYLARHGIVGASASGTPGRGRPRQYTFSDLLLLRVIARLLQGGMSVLRLQKCISELQKSGRSTKRLMTRKYVLTDGYNLYLQDDGVLRRVDSGQMAFAFVLDLSQIRKEVAASIVRVA
ncbi:MerR family transcriptional regulator [Paraburkholderia fungorum]|uniref:DNA-binding transcriptional MerR regulator n=1 Tax=Paraburkholderia fungorum TaxID=134537 RepID=A0AAW3UZE4_9BURK|nr:MerR family transcriptional regulator [Paraburkholderia fungorum]MBB4515861.1 DNA-binding transcriptional MerR regulator [Paraburkholderia fungorum]MBB6203723.1 DNA-binding transcriptional MerR regulator [Paraburkholderia fungorum]